MGHNSKFTVCICKNQICIWSDPGVNLPICKYTPVCICVRMRHLLTPSKICTPEYIYTCVFLVHANWTLVCWCADFRDQLLWVVIHKKYSECCVLVMILQFIHVYLWTEFNMLSRSLVLLISLHSLISNQNFRQSP